MQVNHKRHRHTQSRETCDIGERLRKNNNTSYALVTSPAENFPWHEVRKAREKELAYVRDLRMSEKVDERYAIAQYQVTPVDTKWIDTNKSI